MSNVNDNPQHKINLREQVEGLTQVPYDVAHNALKDMDVTSCIYLVYLGTVSQVSHMLNFPPELPPNALVCKYGMSENLCKRLYQHKLDYGKMIGTDIKLMYYVDVPQKKIRDSERLMQSSFCGVGMRHVVKDKHGRKRKELIVFEHTNANIEIITDIFSEAAAYAMSIDKVKKPRTVNTVIYKGYDTNIKPYVCSCGKGYAQKSSVVRHQASSDCEGMTVHCETKEDVKWRMMLKAKDGEICYLREELSKTREELSRLKTQNNIGTINNNNNNHISITTSQIRKLLPEYSTAPVLTEITDMSQVLNEDDDLFMEDIAYDHRKKILHQTLGDGIVRIYKTADPKQQTIWNTDTSRLNYLIKHAINNRKSGWMIDKKGLRVTEKIITPILSHLKAKMEEYEPRRNDPRSYQTKGFLLEIIMEINDGGLANRINKYIASHFYMTDTVKKNITYKNPKNPKDGW